jgi:integrase/recombinase XerD
MKLSDSSSEYGHFQEARGDSPSHRKESLRVLRLLQGHVGDRDVGEITPDDLQAFIITVRRRHGLKGRKTVSDLTVFAYHRALAAFFNHLCRREAVASNPMRHVPKPKVRQQVIQPFDEAQLRALLAQPDLKTFVGLRDATIMTFLLDAGCRISECLALTFEAVDLEGRTARIAGKGGKDRIVPFGVRTRAWLERYLEKRAQDGGSQLLFVNQFGEKLTRNGMWQRIELYGRKAGLKGVRTSPHTFRHTFAVSWLVGNDDYKGDALSLQTILGHSSPEMTKRYVSFANKDLGKLHDRLSPADRTGFLPRRRTANGSGERHPESEIVGPV